MEPKSIRKNSDLLGVAKILRRNMTSQEKHLWYDFLRYYPVKVYKQRIINNYIADFYCHKARLVIEVDGLQHLTKQGLEYDKLRTEEIALQGLLVLRFANHDVDENFNRVCQIIDETIKERVCNTPSHPTSSGALPKGEPPRE